MAVADDISSFDPVPAVEHWNGYGIRSRLPNFKDACTSKSQVFSYTMSSSRSQPSQNTSTESEEMDTDSASVEPQNDVELPNVVQECDSDYESEVDSDLEEDIVFKKLLE